MSLASTTLTSFKAASTFSAAAASSFAAFERYLCRREIYGEEPMTWAST